MKFKYRAKTSSNKIVDGIVDAPSEFIARDLLKEKSLEVVSLGKQGGGVDALMAKLNRVTTKDLVIFLRQLSVMVEASIPLIKALKVLVNQTANPKLKAITEEVHQDVDSGSKLSEALAKHPSVFSKFFVNIVRAGEASGRLEEVLNYLADQQEKDHDLASKIKGALIYPLVIMIGMIGGGMVMMVTVVPQLKSIFDNMGSELPWQTRILLSTSDFVMHYWWLVIAGAVAFVVAIVYAGKTATGRVVLSNIKLRFPVFGKMFKMMYIVRINRSLYTLLVGGVTVVDALVIVKDIVDDPTYEDILEAALRQVSDGHPLAAELSRHPKFIPTVVHSMIGIGEQSGRMDQMLERVSVFYEKELDNMASNIMVLMEPLIMVVLGISVAIMVLAIFIPLYNMPGF